MKEIYTLSEYIKNNYASKADFARKNGLFPQQVTVWVNKNYIVIDGIMHKAMQSVSPKVKG